MSPSKTILGMEQTFIFQLFKYGIYLLIFINIIQFFIEDYSAAEHTFRDGVDWPQFTDAYATTIDSTAWLILLLMFELETYVISDKKFKGLTRWLLQIIGALCLLMILVAFRGYWDKFMMTQAFALSSYENACAAVGLVQSYAVDLDEYFALTAQNCASISGTRLYLHEANSLLASSDILTRMKNLALTDVVNAGTWILVVIVLEIDLILQVRGELTKKIYKINAYVKSALYLVLFAAAVYWGFLSAFLDFWDAFLWIVAFFLIELNLFQWNEETRTADPALDEVAP